MKIEFSYFYEMSDSQYTDIYKKLCESIEGKSYFNGSIDGLFEDGVSWCLTLSAYVHEDSHTIMPIWWNFATDFRSEAIGNNFTFNYVKELYDDNYKLN